MAITSTATSRHQQATNLSQPERVISMIGGGTLVAYGPQKKSWSGLGLAARGGAIIYRGATGHCDIYQTLGVNTVRRRRGNNVSVPYELGVRVDKTITIGKPPEEVYQFWRNLENVGRFMQHLERVEARDDRRSHWVARGPLGLRFEWEAEVINERENELIAWRSVDGSAVDTAGSVHFRVLPKGRGT